MNLSDCLFLHWTLVGSLVLSVEAVHFSSARRAGGPSRPLLGQTLQSWKDLKKMLPIDIGCIWLVALDHELSNCLSLHWTLVGSLVLSVEGQPLLNQIWDLVLRRSYKDKLFKVRKIWKKMLTMGLPVSVHSFRSQKMWYWLPLVALDHEFI